MRRSRLELVAREMDNSVPHVDFEAYMKARDSDKARIKHADDFRLEVIQKIGGEEEYIGATLPWSKTHENFRFRSGEVTLWVGFNGSMKSLLTGFVMDDLILQDEKVCIASFEMKPKTTLERMLKQAVGTGTPTLEYIDKFFDWSKQKLWLYDQQETVTPERVISVIYYCAEELGVTQFVIDSLMKCVADEDDMNGQKKFVDRLCAAARELDIHIHLVHHSRKKENENTRPTKQDAKGSGSIVDQVDNFFVVFRVPKEEGDREKPDVMLYCDKQRNGEWLGQVALWFNKDSMQFLQSSAARQISMI